MKTLKILFASALILGFSINMNAQVPSDGATASAFVLAELELEQRADIDFGQVARSSSPNLNPVTGAATAGAGLNGTTTSIGKFELKGEDGASIDVSWEKEDLSGPVGSAAIVYTPSVSYGAVNGDFGGGVISDESGDPLAANNLAIDTGGTNYFWVGGTITVDAAQEAGSYEGSFTLTVEYN